MYKKLEVSSLKGAALDWAVAKCEGRDMYIDEDGDICFRDNEFGDYSTNWAQGGPIIGREKIQTEPIGKRWMCFPTKQGGYWCKGDTLLIAAMRCYVASKLGTTIEIPKELL